MMNTRHAHIILTILREGSFTAAAKTLNITQPTLSQTVRQIETQLGESIFVRSHSALTLTPAGELYTQAARKIVRAEQQLQEALSILRGRAEGTLRLGVTPHRSAELLPQVLPDFAAAYPGIQLDVREYSAGELENLLLRSELDMALIPGGTQHAALESRQIASEEVVLIAGKNTALARRIPSGSTVGLREAQDEHFVFPCETSPRLPFIRSLFDACGVTPDVRVVCDNHDAAMRMCSTGNMAMIGPFISLLCDGEAMRRLAHFHLGTDAYLPPIYMVCAKDHSLSPPGETLFSLLSRRYRAMSSYRP